LNNFGAARRLLVFYEFGNKEVTEVWGINSSFVRLHSDCFRASKGSFCLKVRPSFGVHKEEDFTEIISNLLLVYRLANFSVESRKTPRNLFHKLLVIFENYAQQQQR
jgi:hypothetical protein